MSYSKTKVLIASTDSQFLSDHTINLKMDYDVQLAHTADVVFFLIKEWGPKLVLIDGDSVMLNALQQIRLLTPLSQMGIIVLSKSLQPTKEEKSFRDGTDYFLSTQIPYRSIQWRINSLSKRLLFPSDEASIKPPSSIHSLLNRVPLPNVIEFTYIKIFPNDFLVKRGSEIINTTPTQFKLLLAFVSQPEQLLSREWLKEFVWDKANISHRSIDAQISKLKKQIPELNECLINIYGKGYILTLPKKMTA